MHELIEEAKTVIDTFGSDAHKVGAVIRSKDGRLFKSVSVQGQKMHLCSEWAALVQALMAQAEIEMICAVRKKNDAYMVYPPCGLCRELFVTYCPDAMVVISEERIVKATELLPNAYKKS